ncbi:hypothetical protein H2200_009477 [Cladophialophora chaetospira]|uniref:Uncharacterized protein n=1 Tax=Cladophialophora chaetospira TaxID=386627 RepID=A0AA38X2I0_9EURO|nr:hypothetical protein H2200_009477 [Cladophialophora chaetospira]
MGRLYDFDMGTRTPIDRGERTKGLKMTQKIRDHLAQRHPPESHDPQTPATPAVEQQPEADPVATTETPRPLSPIPERRKRALSGSPAPEPKRIDRRVIRETVTTTHMVDTYFNDGESVTQTREPPAPPPASENPLPSEDFAKIQAELLASREESRKMREELERVKEEARRVVRAARFATPGNTNTPAKPPATTIPTPTQPPKDALVDPMPKKGPSSEDVEMKDAKGDARDAIPGANQALLGDFVVQRTKQKVSKQRRKTASKNRKKAEPERRPDLKNMTVPPPADPNELASVNRWRKSVGNLPSS